MGPKNNSLDRLVFDPSYSFCLAPFSIVRFTVIGVNGVVSAKELLVFLLIAQLIYFVFCREDSNILLFACDLFK